MTATAPPATDPGPFLIDGPEYSDRDREMFCLGVEYEHVARTIRSVGKAAGAASMIRSTSDLVHEANVDRLVLVAEGLDLHTKVHDLGDGWCRLRVERGPAVDSPPP